MVWNHFSEIMFSWTLNHLTGLYLTNIKAPIKMKAKDPLNIIFQFSGNLCGKTDLQGVRSEKD